MFTQTGALPASSPRCFFPASILLTCVIALFTISPGVSLVLVQEQPPESAPLFLNVGRGRPCSQEPDVQAALVGAWQRACSRDLGELCTVQAFPVNSSVFVYCKSKAFFDTLLQDETCLWHDLLLDFQKYVNIADLAVSTEM